MTNRRSHDIRGPFSPPRERRFARVERLCFKLLLLLFLSVVAYLLFIFGLGIAGFETVARSTLVRVVGTVLGGALISDFVVLFLCRVVRRVR